MLDWMGARSRRPGAQRVLPLLALTLLAALACACAPAAAPAGSVVEQARSPAASPAARSAPADSVPPAAAPARQTVRFGDVPSIAFAPLYVGIERGYFAAEGLDVDLVNITAGADSVAMLGAGQLDASAGG